MTIVGTSRDFVMYGKRSIRVSTARDFTLRIHGIRVEIIDARFDTPVSSNGTVEMASTGSIIQSMEFFETVHVSTNA